jgi:hypothetical protein
MAKEFRFRALEEATTALDDLRKITGRQDLTQVVIDAFRTYEWILQQQVYGRTIVSENGKPEDATELEVLVKDWSTANEYFSER